jgi:transcription-repair coupling factor (superfamily II helicase)
VASNLFDLVEHSPAVQILRQRLEEGGALSLRGVDQAAHPFLATLVCRVFPDRLIVLVTDSLKTQEVFQQDLETWLRASRASDDRQDRSHMAGPTPASAPAPLCSPLFFPSWEILPHEARLPHADVISERLATLTALLPGLGERSSGSGVLVTSVVALLQKTFHPNALRKRTRLLARGERLNPLDLIEWLEAQGYESEVRVTKKGDLSLRGGIVDVFPLPSAWPVRFEFSGDELESLRFFDPATQVSREETSAVILPPAGELGLLRASLQKQASGLAELEPPATLLDYLPDDTIFLLSEPASIEIQAAKYAEQVPAGDPFFISWDEFLAGLRQRSLTIASLEQAQLPEPSNGPAGLGPVISSLDAVRPLAVRAPDPIVAEAQRREFFAQLHRWLRQDYLLQVFCNNDGELQRFREIWEECGLGRAEAGPGPSAAEAGTKQAEGPETHPVLRLGALSRGFLMEEAKAVVVTDAEVFGRYRIQRPRRLKSAHAPALRSALDINFSELEEGDYVVHLQHGIGRYAGLQAMPRGPNQPERVGEECLVIEYAPTDPLQPPPKLYVPMTEALLVSKYVGAGKARPPLNTLGGHRWARTKAQAERAVQSLAGELLAIQAARASQPGYAFAVDTSWQREFESAFIFEETPDQVRAISETKADMETAKPMDRLICGDVGFGKTEVAIRAAFKAVMSGRQVAVLVPTTVLAQQHYNTFRERMADYPVRIELLSRFRTRRAQRKVIADLAAGSVDIVIGTHRLVQSDIAFKDLGLVVIDEEQRFGVAHKEKFKQLRCLVDVLTLSATPIPRTLYLALTGARDMSTIQTPPHDRLPVETIATPYDERVIRDAILRELGRAGQVFFLHNRVLTIEAMADKLRTLVPDARIVVGHGQMHSDELEEVMTRFVNGEANVLLSTTIIESGLDIPNANTIIIDRADRFGLSDLYQLRGRVGRYKHQAYAYLLIPRHARLLTDARKRISALKQYSTLGSGFKIAMRDLEIRGAGNLLGAEQSGHITAVGFELYCQLLKQGIAYRKGERVKPIVHVQVRIDFLQTSPTDPVPEGAGGIPRLPAKADRRLEPELEIAVPRETWSYWEDDLPAAEPEPSQPPPMRHACAMIPLDYIREPSERIDIYRKLAQITAKTELKALQTELRDRFGPLPAPVELLLLVTDLKLLAAERGVVALETRADKLMLTRNNDYITVGGKFPRLTKTQPKARLNEIRRLLLALEMARSGQAV